MEHPWVTVEEKDYIRNGQDEEIENIDVEIWTILRFLGDKRRYSVIRQSFLWIRFGGCL